MHPEIVTTQADTLRVWAQMWAREDTPTCTEMARRLVAAAEAAEAIAAGTPLPLVLADLPPMPHQDEMREG